MTYRFLIGDAVTRLPVAELPVIQSVSWSEILNTPMSFNCTIPLSGNGVNALTSDMFDAPRAIFIIEKDDVVVTAGPIKTHKKNPESNTFSFSGSGYHDYLRRWKLRTTKTYVAQDQAAIVKDLIDYKQAIAYYNIGIDTSGMLATGVVRDRTYFGYERKWIGELIEQLTGLQNGFDWALLPRWTTVPNSQLKIIPYIGYPNTGRVIGMVLDHGHNCTIFQDSSDDNLAYSVDAIGQGMGETALIITVNNQGLLQATGVGIDAEDRRFDVTQLSTLDSYARQRLIQGQVMKENTSIKVGPEFIGTFIVGDQVQLKADSGLMQLNDFHRIVSYTANVQAEGPEEVTLTTAPLGMFV
jgi:hypothetical protein